MAAKFLCCLPLRFGVIIISFLQFLFTGALGGFLWWALWYNQKNDLAAFTQSMKTTVIIVASIYSAAALVGLLGFFGAVFKKNGFIKTFYVLLCATFGFEIGASVWYLVTFYRTRNQSLDDCINGSTNADRIAYCKSWDVYRRIPQGYLIAAAVVPILVVGYACYIVYQYSRRLEQQKVDKLRQSFIPTTNAAYQPVHRQDEHYPLTQPQMEYPYTDATHSFGHKEDPHTKV